MDKKEQRMAIASACRELWTDKGFKWTSSGLLYRVEDGQMTTVDPLNDLNVMAEVKKGLNRKELRNSYLNYLWELLGLVKDSYFWDENNSIGLQKLVLEVTAEQEAEAFLKAIDLWKTDENSTCLLYTSPSPRDRG